MCISGSGLGLVFRLWRDDVGGAQQAVEIVYRVPGIGRARCGIAEAVTCPIIGARARHGGDLSLDVAPDHHTLARTRVEQHRGLARAQAVQVDPSRPVDRYELLGMEIDVRGNGGYGRYDDEQSHELPNK